LRLHHDITSQAREQRHIRFSLNRSLTGVIRYYDMPKGWKNKTFDRSGPVNMAWACQKSTLFSGSTWRYSGAQSRMSLFAIATGLLFIFFPQMHQTPLSWPLNVKG
jgi:hypothetical protein